MSSTCIRVLMVLGAFIALGVTPFTLTSVTLVATHAQDQPIPSWSAAYGLNDGGQSVGIFQGASRQAIAWQSGRMETLPALPGDPDSHAISINASGSIVGWSGTFNGRTDAVRWQDGRVSVLDALPGDRGATALAINDEEQIAGYPNRTTFQTMRLSGSTAKSPPLLRCRGMRKARPGQSTTPDRSSGVLVPTPADGMRSFGSMGSQ